MRWSTQHDILLCKEVLLQEPYNYKVGTRERGQTWDMIANHLNKQPNLRFVVDQRAVRDRYMTLERKLKRKLACDEKASEQTRNSEMTSKEMRQLHEIIKMIMERSEVAEEELACGGLTKKQQAEKEEAAELRRKRAMEKLADSTKEVDNQEDHSKKKKGRNNGEIAAVELLHNEMNKHEMDLKREEFQLRKKEQAAKERAQQDELDLRRRELSLKEREQEAREKKYDKLLTLITKHQQQQETMLLQMHQQNQSILQLLTNLNKAQ
eukprot:gene9468-10455_t